jgi:ubiquinone biosynthesis protein COQ9
MTQDERNIRQQGDIEAMKAALVAAALPHVVFDGWTARTLAEAARDTGIPLDRARLAFPRGGVDLALAFHNQRDAELARDLAEADLGGMRFRDKIGHAVMRRLELVAGDREAVRRGAALFALPHHAPDAARAIWHTADTIWNALGDTSRDLNWYSKRTTLSAVYSSAVLYWLGDETPGFSATREFVQRRIDNVMRIEEAKAKLRKNPVAAALMRGPQRLLDRIQAPANTAPPDLPGSWNETR